MQTKMHDSKKKLVAVDHPWISNELVPIYRWTFPTHASDEELFACLAARDEWVRQTRHHFAWIIDLSNVTRAPATQRRAVSEHLKRHEEFSARWNVGSALIVPNAWLRGLVTAVFWISPPKYPHQTFADPEEALHWARRQMTTHQRSMT